MPFGGFNPRPYERGDHCIILRDVAKGCFNPRPYERGDRQQAAKIIRMARFQSTPLREGRRINRLNKLQEAWVSIHAPTRGATLSDRGMRRFHACFNPRPYERGDETNLQIARETNVSIHAPTRGATGTGFNIKVWQGFQSTPLREGRLTISLLW